MFTFNPALFFIIWVYMHNIYEDFSKRRTFAIISHPDAGKTTVTEKLLLFGGANQLAGTVKSRKSDKHAKSDWMEMEKERGISVTTSVMQFIYNDYVVNLLDTPGHEDFSEDTYRTLTAVDSNNDVGYYSSLDCSAGAADCKIAYGDFTTGNLKFADCDNAACSSKTIITLDGNLLINATAGSATTTKTLNTANQTWTLVSDKTYPTGSGAGSLGAGIYTFHVHFTLSVTPRTSVKWKYEFGYCLVSDNCATQTAHITSDTIDYVNGTSSPQGHDVTAGSAISVPAPQDSKFLYFKITVVEFNTDHGAFVDCADAACSR